MEENLFQIKKMDNVLIRKSLKEWVNCQDWKSPFAVTLTLKQVVFAKNEAATVRVPISTDLASQNFRHFLNLLNRRVFGKSATRYQKSVNVIPVLEGGNGDKRFHYHAVIDCPRNDLAKEFPKMIAECWSKTQWGYTEIDIQPKADGGWINYMTKFRDKTDFGTSIDWMNVKV